MFLSSHTRPPNSQSILSRLPLDLLERIFFQLNLRDLRIVAALCRPLRNIVHQHVVRTTDRAFQLAGLDTSHMLELLATTRSIISGSFVLMLLNPWTFIANDVDIYVMKGMSDTVIYEMCTRYNLTLVPEPHSNPEWEEREYVFPNIAKVFRCASDCVSINVLESTSYDPIPPLYSFHSSAVINYLSGTELYCAYYPELTFSFRNLLSTHFYKRAKRSDSPAAIKKFKSCVDKYMNRGYEYFHAGMGCCKFGQHLCLHDPYCPRTIRHIYDGHGFRYFLHGLTKLRVPGTVPRFPETEESGWNLI